MGVTECIFGCVSIICVTVIIIIALIKWWVL